MTNAVIDWLKAELAKAEAVIHSDLTEVEREAIAIEQKLAAGLKPLVAKIVATIGSQGLTILEQGVSDLVTVIASGGNISTALATLIPQVTAQVKDDLKQDAATAAHGAAELLIAALPVPAPTAAEVAATPAA